MAYQSLATVAEKVEASMLTQTIYLNTAAWQQQGLPVISRPEKRESETQEPEDFISIRDVCEHIQKLPIHSDPSFARSTIESGLQWDQITQQLLKLFLFPKVNRQIESEEHNTENGEFWLHVRQNSVKVLRDESLLMDLSNYEALPEYQSLSLTPIFKNLDVYSQNLRALSLQSQQKVYISTIFLELQDLQGLAILNLQGISCIDNNQNDVDLATSLKDFKSASLQFINVSATGISELVLEGSSFPGLIEIVAHSNEILTLRGLQTLPNLRLLDIENNQLTDQYVPGNLEVFSNKFNFNININRQVLKGIKVLNPPSVKSYSYFKKFGALPFGDPCQLKPSKRVIKICPTDEIDLVAVACEKLATSHQGNSTDEIWLEQQTRQLLWQTKGLFKNSSAESVHASAFKTNDQLSNCASIQSNGHLQTQISQLPQAQPLTTNDYMYRSSQQRQEHAASTPGGEQSEPEWNCPPAEVNFGQLAQCKSTSEQAVNAMKISKSRNSRQTSLQSQILTSARSKLLAAPNSDLKLVDQKTSFIQRTRTLLGRDRAFSQINSRADPSPQQKSRQSVFFNQEHKIASHTPLHQPAHLKPGKRNQENLIMQNYSGKKQSASRNNQRRVGNSWVADRRLGPNQQLNNLGPQLLQTPANNIQKQIDSPKNGGYNRVNMLSHSPMKESSCKIRRQHQHQYPRLMMHSNISTQKQQHKHEFIWAENCSQLKGHADRKMNSRQTSMEPGESRGKQFGNDRTNIHLQQYNSKNGVGPRAPLNLSISVTAASGAKRLHQM